jgi:hypothetical protein
MDSRAALQERHDEQGVHHNQGCNTRKAKKSPDRAQTRTDVCATEDHDNRPHAGVAAVMPSQPIVRCQRQRLSFLRRGPGVSRTPVTRAGLSTLLYDGESTGRPFRRDEAHRLPQKVRGFYRRFGTESRPPATKLQHARAFDRCCCADASKHGVATAMPQALSLRTGAEFRRR